MPEKEKTKSMGHFSHGRRRGRVRASPIGSKDVIREVKKTSKAFRRRRKQPGIIDQILE